MSSLYEQIYSFILNGIKDGQYKKGDRIPTEIELAKQFNVSRITSKKALDLLAEQHIIERFQGKGSFISSSLPDLNNLILDEKVKGANSEFENLIGLIISDFTDTYGLDLVKAIEKRSSEHEYNLVLKRSFGDEEEEKKAINSFVKMGVKGIIILPAQGVHYNNELLRLVVEQYPLVLIDRYLKGIPASSVSIDNKEAARVITKYLLDNGHSEIAYISPPAEGTSSLEERLMGLHVAFSEKGKHLNPDYILSEIQSTKPKNIFHNKHQAFGETDQQKIQQFIRKNQKISTIICSEFEIAVLLVKVLEMEGKKVPKDISVVCFDSPPAYLNSHLFTHVQQNQEMMGFKAVDLLIEQLNGNKTPLDCKIDFRLVKGKSTILKREGNYE